MINKAILIGRLTRDPDIRATHPGTSYCSFLIAVDNQDAKGAEKTTSFINCVCFGEIADNLGKYQKKGALIVVEGRLLSRSSRNKEEERVYSTEIICEAIKPAQNNSDNGVNHDFELSDED